MSIFCFTSTFVISCRLTKEKIFSCNENEFHFPFLSLTNSGIVIGAGAAMVRESAAVMVGYYFKRRRQFVEMIVMAGEGVGIALFSVILKEGVG